METKQEYKIGDCLELLPEIKDNSVDMILCDLPYGTTACKWDTVIPFAPLWEQYYRVLRPNGFIVLTGSQPFTTEMIHSNIDNFSHQWIWEKEQGSTPLLANVMPMKNFEDVIVFSNEYKHDIELNHPLRSYFKNIIEFIGLELHQINSMLGHRKAEHAFYVNTTQFSLCTQNTYLELIKIFGIDDMDGFIPFESLDGMNCEFLNRWSRIYNPQKTKGAEYVSGGGYIEHLDACVIGGNKSDERYPKSIIKFNTDKNKSIHPTQKPIPLAEYLIKTYTNEGDTVHDSCMGSGWSMEASRNLNRNYIGHEISDEWEDNYKRILSDHIQARLG